MQARVPGPTRLSDPEVPASLQICRRVVEAAPIAMGCLRREDGRWLYGNGALCDLLGSSPEALAGATLNRKGDGPLEQCRLTPAGDVRWIRFTFSVFDDALVLAVAEDITRLRALEVEVQDTRTFLDTAEVVADMGSWCCDLADNRLQWTQHVFRIFGIDPNTFDGSFDVFMNLLFPEDRAVLEEAGRRTAEEGAPFNIDHRIIRPDGQVRWVHERAQRVADDDGRPVRIIGVVQDITERRLADEHRRENEARLRRLAESSMIGFIYWDRSGRIFDANNYFLDLVGYTREDLETGLLHWKAMTPPEYAHLDVRALDEISDCGYCTPFEKEYLRKDGSRVAVLLGASALDESGQHGVCFVLDITRRRQLELQLQQSQRMDAIGRLAGGVAHDFNNMLAVILGYSSQLLGRLRDDDPSRRPIQAIEQAGMHAASLTRQLLAFGRKQVLSPRALDLNAVLRRMESMLQPLLGEPIELTVDLDPAVEWVQCDPAQLEQIVMNLVLNARDAMPDGGSISVSSTRVTSEVGVEEGEVVLPGGHVVLSIADQGHGIAADVLPRLFEPFFSTKKAGNTGLGLAVVYGIVRQSGGHIAVESEVGRGTTFRVYLPCAREAPALPAACVARGVSLPRADDETILLVEDEDMVRDLAQSYLSGRGFQVLSASSPHAALEILRHHEGPIHLLLTDVVMPRMSGAQLAEQARALRPRTRVMFMSAYADDDVMRHGLHKGVRLLQKPFHCEVLLREVREALEEA